jgi:DNA-binding response OmpR family regulator
VASVLIIEDDTLIQSSIARSLSAKGYHVELASSAREALASPTVDLILCDLGLPDNDGLLLVQQLMTQQPDAPVIILTARDHESDIVAGLGSGAVDYMVKPFGLSELEARIQLHLRLRHGQRPKGPVRVGVIRIDSAARRVYVRDVEVALRPKEFDLLLRLALNPGEVVRREQLIDDVWGGHLLGSTKTLDVHVNALRRKIGDTPGEPVVITVARGVGYRLEITE